MNCNCFERVNAALVSRNGKLLEVLHFGKTKKPRPRVACVAVEKLESIVRQKPGILLAEFCPFCGTKYPESS